MAKKPHVPKFGDWDSNNISYTACFENARKDGVRRNPNDPEENPEAFKSMLDSTGTSSSSKTRISTEKVPYQNEGDTRHGSHRRMNEHKVSVGSHKSNASESGSEKSNSDYSLLQQQSRRRRERSDRRKSLASSGSEHSISHSHSQSSKPKSTSTSHQSSTLGHDTHTRVPSIPKFGDWDEKDPKSGEGFTFIFEQVKEEKKTASKFTALPQEPDNHLNNANKRGKSSSKSKSWCCLF